MKTIIAGSRGCTDYSLVFGVMTNIPLSPTAIISGCARGVDRLGERYALEMGLPCIRMPADWHKYGKRAGYLRNQQMAEAADALVAIWDGESKGTKNMIDIAKRLGLIVHVWSCKGGRRKNE